MKKTFRSILAGALALLAVSCYDDTDLQNKYGDLNDRVSAIENTLNAEVGGVNDLIERVEALEGKVAAIKVETDEKGVTTLTLSDDSKVVLSKNGVLTVKEGVWYTVDPKTGAETAVGKVGHKLDFKVENGVLMYKPEGEANYTSTEVKVSDYTAHVIGNVVPSEDGKTVAVTIGDQTLTLALAVADGSVSLNYESAFVGYGLSKTVKVNGATDFYVAAKPDGWKVEQEGNTITIWAPSKKLVELGAAHTSGKIVVHADADKCAYASMTIETGDPFSVTIDKEGNITFANSIVAEIPDLTGMYEPEYGFMQAYVGFQNLEWFVGEMDTAEGMQYYIKNDLVRYTFSENLKINAQVGGKYVEGEYERDVYTLSLAKLAEVMDVTIEEGSAYAVWVLPADSNGEKLEFYNYSIYKPAKTIFSAEEIKHNDAKLYADLSGAEKYFVGAIKAEDNDGNPIDFMTIIGEAYPLNMVLMGYADEVSDYYVEGKYEGEDAYSMSYLNFDMKLTPGTSYYYYVVPYNAGMQFYDPATQILPYVKKFTTTSLTAGEVTLPEITAQVGFTGVTATVTPASGTTVYYAFVESDQLMELETPDAKMSYLLARCFTPIVAGDEYNTIENYADPGETMILLYGAITEDAEFAVANTTFKTMVLPTEVNNDLNVSFSDEVIGVSEISVTLTPAEGVTTYWNYYNTSTLAEGGYYGDESSLFTNMLNNAKDAAVVPVAKDQYLSPGMERTLVVLLVKGNEYRIVKKAYVTTSLTYNENITLTPVSMIPNDADETLTVKFNVANAEKAAFMLDLFSTMSQFELNAFTQNPDAVVIVDVVDGVAEVAVPGYWGLGMTIFATGLNVDADGNVTAIAKNSYEAVVREYLGIPEED